MPIISRVSQPVTAFHQAWVGSRLLDALATFTLSGWNGLLTTNGQRQLALLHMVHNTALLYTRAAGVCGAVQTRVPDVEWVGSESRASSRFSVWRRRRGWNSHNFGVKIMRLYFVLYNRNKFRVYTFFVPIACLCTDHHESQMIDFILSSKYANFKQLLVVAKLFY